MGVHSYSTADAYRDVWKDLLNFTKENFGIKDIEKLQSEHIKNFLEDKVSKEVAHSTFMQYASALEKLEVALNSYAESHNTGKEYSFSESISEVREVAHQELERFDSSRAYSNPQELISNIGVESFRIASELQFYAGLRVSELGELKMAENGKFEVLGKGGKIREVEMSKELADKVENYLKHNDFKWSDSELKAYRQELMKASINSNQEYNSTHGLRWNYAQDKMQTLQEQGLTYEQSLVEVSQSMGHERADITEHYLR